MPQALVSSQKFYVPEVISRFLKSRGYFDAEDQHAFVKASLKDIQSPFILKDMDMACTRLAQALNQKEAVGIYCDYDMDGSSAAALLDDAFRKLGFHEVYIYQPRRLKEGYGFHKEGVDFFKGKNVSLVVTVDVGITGHEACLYAKEEGLDVIITDHHLPDAKLPEACAVINPNTKECLSGLGHLCGAGVAFYLVYGLAKYLKEHEKKILPEFKLEDLLDYFVVGTLTDMVPLVKENRALTKAGLKKFSRTQRPGLRALMAKADVLGKDLSSQDIGFKIAPKLNSLSRLDTDLRPTAILMEKSSKRAKDLVEEAYRVNEQRLSFLEEGLNEARAHFEAHPPENFIFYVSNKIHPGVMGLIATRLVEEYDLPTFIGSQSENNLVVGSARLPAQTGLSLKELLSFCPSLLQYGGHAEAAGYELRAERLKEFEVQIGLYLEDLSSKESHQALGPQYDCEVYLSELGKEFLSWLKHLEPFGVGFEQPTFKVSGLEILKAKKLKDQHYKLTVGDQRGYTCDLLWFFYPSDHELALLLDRDEGNSFTCDFYVHPQINFFRGQESLQLLFNDVEVKPCLP